MARVINTRTFYKIYHIYFKLFWKCLVHRLNHKAKYPCSQSKLHCSKKEIEALISIYGLLDENDFLK